MRYIGNKRCYVVIGDRVDRAGCTVVALAWEPVLPVLIGHGGINQLHGFAAAVMLGDPAPAAMAAVTWPQLPQAPVALIGITDRIDPDAGTVDQLDPFTAVAQLAVPASDDVSNAWVDCLERGHIRRHHKIPPRAERHIGKDEIHGIAETPA